MLARGDKITLETEGDGTVEATITSVEGDRNGYYYIVRWPTSNPGVHGNSTIAVEDVKDGKASLT